MDNQRLPAVARAFVAVCCLAISTACSTDPAARTLKFLNSGKQYFQKGQLQEAGIQFRNALQIDPRSADAHYQLARTYLRSGQTQAARREFSEAVTLDPKNSDAELQLASLLLAGRQYDEAAAKATAVLAADPGNARAHSILGSKYALTRDVENAVSEYRKSVQLEPHWVEVYAGLGAVYLAAGRTAEAEAIYRKAIDANPNSSQAHLSLGQFLFSQGKTAEAVAEVRAAAGLDPQAVPVQLTLVNAYIAAGKVSEAEALCRKLKTVAPDDPQGYQALGLFYASMGQKEKAVAEFQSVMGAKPNDLAVKDHLAENLIDLDRIPEAEALTKVILSSNPEDAQGLLCSGRILVAKRRYQEAAAALQKANVRTDKRYYLLGFAQNALGFSDSARGSFTKALELNPGMPEAAAGLAGIGVKQGDYDRAIRLAGEALEKNPDLTAAYLARAQAFLAKGEFAGSEAQVQEVLKRAPDSLPALTLLMKLAIIRGNTREALERLLRVSRQNPRDAGMHLLLGLGYYQLKDLDKAESNVRQAIELDPKTPGAFTLLANIDLARGGGGKAKTDLRLGLEANPRNITNYMALETEYAKESNWAEATKLCERAHEIEPSSPAVALELAYLYLEHGGDINVALSLAQAAKQKLPASPVAADVLGWAYYKLGSVENALEQLKDCAQKAPGNAQYQYHLGMAYAAAGKPQLAERSLQSALRTEPGFPDAANARKMLAKIMAR